jgi:hypothetical protein
MQAGVWPQEGSGWLPINLKNVAGSSVLLNAFDSSVALSPRHNHAREAAAASTPAGAVAAFEAANRASRRMSR